MSKERNTGAPAPTVDELKEVFQRAATVAAAVPEHLQAAAFSKAVDEILGEGRGREAEQRLTRSAKSRRTKNATAPRSTGSANRRATGSGPQTAVEGMIDEGFFDTPQPLEKIIQSLQEERGYHFLRQRAATAVLRLLRAHRLVRSKNAAGDYEYRRS
jgi:hypothetical protein